MADTKLVTHFNKVCRICLSQDDLNNSIFSCSHENKTTFAESVMTYVPIQILIDDGLPTLICDSCLNSLESFLKLCKRCLISDKILRQPSLNDNVSNEIITPIKIEDDSEVSREEDLSTDRLEDCPSRNDITDENVEKWFDSPKPNIKRENTLSKAKQERKGKRKKSSNVKLVKSVSRIRKGSTVRYQCEFCGKPFAQKSYLDIHARTHTGERPFKCNICRKSFAQKVTLKIHSAVHSGERPFSCEKCGKSFTQKSNLLTHMTVHTGEQRFSCEICSKRFSRKGHLVTHARIHSGEKPYECNVCNKRFSLKCGLKAHETMHSDEKPFECPTCGKPFSRKDALNVHVKIHSGEKPFGCQICGKLFGRKDKLVAHSKIHSSSRRDTSVNFSRQEPVTIIRRLSVQETEES